MSKLNRSRRGAVLIPAIICVMSVAMLSTAYMQISMDKSREARAAVEQKQAFYVAEAGLAEGFYALAQGKSGAVASPDLPAGFGSGIFWVDSHDLGGGRISLRSTGLVGRGRASLSMTLQRHADSLGSFGIFSDQDVHVGSGALLDSYDSSQGPYVAPVAPSGGKKRSTNQATQASPSAAACLSSNGSITLGGSPGAVVFGNAQPGPEGSVTVGRQAQVYGSLAPALELRSLPALQVEAPEAAQDYDCQGPGTGLLASGNYQFNAWNLHQGVNLTVRGPAQIVVDRLFLQDNASLNLDTSEGAIAIWVRSEFVAEAGTSLNTTEEATDRFSLMIAASQVQLSASGTLHGLVYAPEADLQWPGGLELFGSVAAKSLAIGANAKLHYDRALGTNPEGSSGVPQLVCWRVVELPPETLVTMKLDPLSVLKASNVVPVKPQESHVLDAQAYATVEEEQKAKNGKWNNGCKGRRAWRIPGKGGH
jgi:hypothetical protein